MVKLDEESIENFIRENRDKFGIYRPPEGHMDKFFFKLNYRIRHFVSIVPYLIRVAVVTLFIFIASVVVWNSYLRKDRHEITLENKISSVINKMKSG